MPRKDDGANIIRIKHMLEAASEAMSFIEGKSREDLDSNRMLTLSLIKDIEIIGEAANKVDSDFCKKHSDIPWTAIITTRNRLIHGYFNIDADIVWKTVTVELPKLIEALERIIP